MLMTRESEGVSSGRGWPRERGSGRECGNEEEEEVEGGKAASGASSSCWLH